MPQCKSTPMSPRTGAKGEHNPGLNPVLRTLVAAASISLVVFLYERALVPLYGSGPTTFLLQEIILATILVAEFIPSSSSPTWFYLPALCLSLAPNTIYWVAVTTSRRGNPIQGTVITHLAVLAPLLLSVTTLALKSNVSVPVFMLALPDRSSIKATPHSQAGSGGSPIYSSLALGFRVASGLILPSTLWKRVSSLNNVSESSMVRPPCRACSVRADDHSSSLC